MRVASVHTNIFFSTDTAQVFLSWDDVYRMVLMIVLFGIVFPFSMSNFARRKWFGPTQWVRARGTGGSRCDLLTVLQLHLAAAAMFTIDQLRRSPHGQIFNVPCIA